jgi:hypothetical protein
LLPPFDIDIDISASNNNNAKYIFIADFYSFLVHSYAAEKIPTVRSVTMILILAGALVVIIIRVIIITNIWQISKVCDDTNSVDETRTMGLRSPSTAQFEQLKVRAAIRTKISRRCDSEICCLAKRYPES